MKRKLIRPDDMEDALLTQAAQSDPDNPPLTDAQLAQFGRAAARMPAGKTRITIFIDDEVLARFRERAGSEGKGYQTLINEVLRNAVAPESAPVTLETLRRVLREELHTA